MSQHNKQAVNLLKRCWEQLGNERESKAGAGGTLAAAVEFVDGSGPLLSLGAPCSVPGKVPPSSRVPVQLDCSIAVSCGDGEQPDASV